MHSTDSFAFDQPLSDIAVKPRKREASVAEKFTARTAAWNSRPEILRNRHRIFLGDARTMTPLKEEGAVQLVVTSPPYWDLKEYAGNGEAAQLGHINDREEFMGELGRVWKRCFDLLTPGGRLCVVVGDVCRARKSHGRHRVEPLHAYIQVQCQALGFDPLAPIIWSKIANMTTEVAGGGGFLGKPYEPNAVVKNDIEFVLMFRKPGAYRKPTQLQRDLSMISKEDHRRWFQQIWADVKGEPQKIHPAPFPSEIARRLIGMFSFVGDTVLDPFWGIGNTTHAAMAMHRSSVGFEIEPSYLEAGRQRFQILPEDSTIGFHQEHAQ
jgi:modification methylase